MTPSPFLLDDEALYQRWREQKLQNYPVYLDDLVVEVNDPRKLRLPNIRPSWCAATRRTWQSMREKPLMTPTVPSPCC